MGVSFVSVFLKQRTEKDWHSTTEAVINKFANCVLIKMNHCEDI